ncbi:hypothetical protein [Methylophilus sp. OH31]|uniref:hypothetical protein n=1 Tax=Methylophilus sp. OH31 TaxID=1387312 RepID=UPI000462F218|nr:hypothetical protein [Methylophilus sp. OH31]
MSYKTIKSTQEIEAVDIPTMADMPLDEYKDYLRFGLMSVDHHDNLRSAVAGYPLATNQEQLKALIAYLNEIASKVGS